MEGMQKLHYDELGKCLEKLKGLRKYAPKSIADDVDDMYLIEWARFKRAIAERAAECIRELLGNIVREIYYIELSDSWIGRDIDLYIVLDEEKATNLDAREVEETLEELLTKLTLQAGIDIRPYTDTPSIFEIHTSIGGIYGSKGLPRSVRPIKLYP